MTPDQCYLLGSIEAASASEPPTNPPESFRTLRRNDDLSEERARLHGELDRDPDKTLVLRADMPILHTEAPGAAAAALWTCPMHAEYQAIDPGACPHCGMPLVPVETSWTCPLHEDVVADSPGTCPRCGMALVPRAPTDATTGHAHTPHEPDGLEWEDLMPDLNARTDDQNMIWQIVDADTGTVNTQIDWSFRVGDRVKIRLVNTMDDNDHPMHHPFHVHGAGRFLILARDGDPEPNLVWKDTVLVRAGETVDLLLDVTTPGVWMAHCHIAEHHQDGMMFKFRVDP
jgi:FtsP/CotA-like multicopper oxidase with cupredoxin domain